MKKITEYTGGTHIYMKLQLDDGCTEEIDVTFPDGKYHFKTTGDSDPNRRDQIITAFLALY